MSLGVGARWPGAPVPAAVLLGLGSSPRCGCAGLRPLIFQVRAAWPGAWGWPRRTADRARLWAPRLGAAASPGGFRPARPGGRPHLPRCPSMWHALWEASLAAAALGPHGGLWPLRGLGTALSRPQGVMCAPASRSLRACQSRGSEGLSLCHFILSETWAAPQVGVGTARLAWALCVSAPSGPSSALPGWTRTSDLRPARRGLASLGGVSGGVSRWRLSRWRLSDTVSLSLFDGFAEAQAALPVSSAPCSGHHTLFPPPGQPGQKVPGACLRHSAGDPGPERQSPFSKVTQQGTGGRRQLEPRTTCHQRRLVTTVAVPHL